MSGGFRGIQTLIVVTFVLVSAASTGAVVAVQPDGAGAGVATLADAPTSGGSAGNGSDAGNVTTDPENGSDAANATSDADGGPPSAVENFTATSPVRANQTDPASLAGKLRVESAYRANTSVELVRNSSTNFTLAVNVTGGAENVSFYLQERAFAASQNLSNVTAELDGEPLAVGTTEANGSAWVGFEVDHFSTRTVSFRLHNATDGTGGDSAPSGPPALPGQANAPIDADGDGLYEDVNGDGGVDVLDVAELLSSLNSDAVQQNAGSFDFSGDGGVNVIDVAELLDQL